MSTLASLATMPPFSDVVCRPDSNYHTSDTLCEDSPAHHAQNCAAAWAQHEERCSIPACSGLTNVTAWTTATPCPAANVIMMPSYHKHDKEGRHLCLLLCYWEPPEATAQSIQRVFTITYVVLMRDTGCRPRRLPVHSLKSVYFFISCFHADALLIVLLLMLKLHCCRWRRIEDGTEDIQSLQAIPWPPFNAGTLHLMAGNCHRSDDNCISPIVI